MPLNVRKEDEIIWGKKTGYKAEWLVFIFFSENIVDPVVHKMRERKKKIPH